MAVIYNSHEKIHLKNIEDFEEKHDIKLPIQYRTFLLEYNGGNVKPNVFKISEEEGETVANTLYGLDISESYDDLSNVFESLHGDIPDEFLSIGDDSGGNQICLGVSGEYRGKIYIFILDIVSDEEMSNMFFIADSFEGFLENYMKLKISIASENTF